MDIEHTTPFNRLESAEANICTKNEDISHTSLFEDLDCWHC